MMKFAVIILLFSAAPVMATPTTLKFDTPKLCQWQYDNNSMNITECANLEDDAHMAVPALEARSSAERLAACEKEALSFSGDSGFASYTVYAACLKDGPGSQ